MSGKRVDEKSKHKMKKRTKFTILAVVNPFDHTVSPELTVGWFAAWTAELALLYGIKVKEKPSDESQG